MARFCTWYPSFLGRVNQLLLGILTVAVTLLYTNFVTAQTPPTITLSVPANSQFEEGEGNTTVVITATLSSAQTTDTVIDLSLAGTAKSTDYTVVTLPDITISANQTMGTAELILNPVDDNYFEGKETVKINGTISGFTVTSVDVPLIDNDAKPNFDFQLWHSDRSKRVSSYFDEGETVNLILDVVLTGGVFEEDQTVTITAQELSTPTVTISEDIDFGEGNSPPWEITIKAGKSSGTRKLSFIIVDDEENETQEFMNLVVNLMAAGEEFTVRKSIGISSSDNPLVVNLNCGYYPEYPGESFTRECQLFSSQKATKKYTVTYNSKNPELTHDEMTFTLEKGETKSTKSITFTSTTVIGQWHFLKVLLPFP